MDNGLPTTEALEQSIERVQQRLLQRVAEKRGRARAARIVLGIVSGVILFTGGIAVGGAAFALPSSHSSAGASAPILTVACHTGFSGSSASSLLQFSVPSVVDDVREDPAATCATAQSAADENRALSAGVTTLYSKGISCGYIDIEGLSTYYFNGDLLTTDLADISVPADCNTSIPVTVPAPERYFVACAASANRAEVYSSVNPAESAASFCESLHETVWRR